MGRGKGGGEAGSVSVEGKGRRERILGGGVVRRTFLELY